MHTGCAGSAFGIWIFGFVFSFYGMLAGCRRTRAVGAKSRAGSPLRCSATTTASKCPGSSAAAIEFINAGAGVSQIGLRNWSALVI
jgi:hypothetical protein